MGFKIAFCVFCGASFCSRFSGQEFQIDAHAVGEIAGLFDQLGGCARDSFDVDVAVKAVTIT